ncbi:MAG: riboflavin synthase [Planctomycetota bacterium]
MFTGLVESQGIVRQVVTPQDASLESQDASLESQDASLGPGRRYRIDAGQTAEGVQIGDSIAINGCCLTVVAIDGSVLDFEAGEETLSRTQLGKLASGDRVNLERALRAGDRLGGHYVTGHVDCLGELQERHDDPPWANLRFRLPPRYARQVASKGSIAIDGVSLTVVDADPDSFTVALIPHTLDATTLGSLAVGDVVNLETDVLAKYVERSLGRDQEDDS